MSFEPLPGYLEHYATAAGLAGLALDLASSATLKIVPAGGSSPFTPSAPASCWFPNHPRLSLRAMSLLDLPEELLDLIMQEYEELLAGPKKGWCLLARCCRMSFYACWGIQRGLKNTRTGLLKRLAMPRLYRSLTAGNLDDARLHSSIGSNGSLALLIREVTWQVQHRFLNHRITMGETTFFCLDRFRAQLDFQLSFLERCTQLTALKIYNYEFYGDWTPSMRRLDMTLPMLPDEFVFPWLSETDLRRLSVLQQLSNLSIKLVRTDDGQFSHQPMYSLVHHLLHRKPIKQVSLQVGLHFNGPAMFGHDILPTVTALSIVDPEDFQLIRLCPNLVNLSVRHHNPNINSVELNQLLNGSSEQVVLSKLTRLELSGPFSGSPYQLAQNELFVSLINASSS